MKDLRVATLNYVLLPAKPKNDIPIVLRNSGFPFYFSCLFFVHFLLLLFNNMFLDNIVISYTTL